jgi:hypothetical protein
MLVSELIYFCSPDLLRNASADKFGGKKYLMPPAGIFTIF